MTITIEKTVAEIQQSRSLLFRQSGRGDMWMGFAVILIALAFYTESYFRKTDDTLHVQLGGVVSWCGVFGVAALLYDSWRRGKSATAQFTDEDVQFVELTADGLLYGVRGSWANSVAWTMVDKVRLTQRYASFDMPHLEVRLTLAHFDAAERQELERFLAETRSPLEPSKFFGLKVARSGPTYGPLRATSCQR